MSYNCDDTKSDILQALSNFTNSRYPFVFKQLIDSGVVSYLMNIDTKSPKQTITHGLRIIGNLLTADDQTTEEMIKYGVITILDKLLFYPLPQIRKEAAWCLSNIAAGTKGQINAIIDSGVIKRLGDLVKDAMLEVAREAIWTISNCLSGADLDLSFKLATNGAIPPLIYVLMNHQEPTILGITLEGLSNLFSQGEIVCQLSDNVNPFVNFFNKEGGVEYLERLQTHQNYEIYKLCINLLERYFKTQTVNN